MCTYRSHSKELRPEEGSHVQYKYILACIPCVSSDKVFIFTVLFYHTVCVCMCVLVQCLCCVSFMQWVFPHPAKNLRNVCGPMSKPVKRWGCANPSIRHLADTQWPYRSQTTRFKHFCSSLLDRVHCGGLACVMWILHTKMAFSLD